MYYCVLLTLYSCAIFRNNSTSLSTWLLLMLHCCCSCCCWAISSSFRLANILLRFRGYIATSWVGMCLTLLDNLCVILKYCWCLRLNCLSFYYNSLYIVLIIFIQVIVVFYLLLLCFDHFCRFVSNLSCHVRPMGQNASDSSSDETQSNTPWRQTGDIRSCSSHEHSDYFQAHE